MTERESAHLLLGCALLVAPGVLSFTAGALAYSHGGLSPLSSVVVFGLSLVLGYITLGALALAGASSEE